MINKISATVLMLFLITSISVAQNKATDSNNQIAIKLVKKMVKKMGSYEALRNKKDVIYTYSYSTPDGKLDQSIEKYIFDGELSYGQYVKHQRTFPDLKGTFEQGFDGENYWLKHDNLFVNDPERIKRVAFNRPTNFYWFTMFQKLLDPGLTYEYKGDKLIDNQVYDIVKISFESNSSQPKDIYQLYINRKTSLADQFLFTVVDFNVIDTPFLMKVEYEKIDGLLIPTKRKYKKSTWDAKVSNEEWINVLWTNISFNNNVEKEVFMKTVTE